MIVEEIINYLMDSYYAHYKGIRNDIIPTREQIRMGFDKYPDRFIIIKDSPESEKIMGCAIFLTLNDETYKNIENYDISDVKTLSELLKESGDNIHFVLLAAENVSVIRAGIRLIKKERHPKTISWWEPNFSRLHRYNSN